MTTSDDTSTGTGPGADRPARRNRRRDAADRDAGGERRRPFAAEAEPFAGNVIDDRPVDQIGLGDRGDAAQDERGCEIEPPGRLHRNESAEDDDRDLDVELRPDRFLDPVGKAREKIGDDEAGEERDDVAALICEPERPVDTEALQVRRRDGGEMGVVADDPARMGDPEHGREGNRKAAHIGAERRSAGREHGQQREIGHDEGAGAAEIGIGLGERRKRKGGIGPHRGRHHPAEEVDAPKGEEGQRENHETDRKREPILADRRGGGVRGGGA
jgi:hypothetical protein